MKIFGIYGGYLNHDPGVCLIEDGKIVFSWNEERPRRIKPSKIDDLQKINVTVGELPQPSQPFFNWLNSITSKEKGKDFYTWLLGDK